MSEISLQNSELKHILKEVHCLSGYDFSQYSYSFILRRTEQFMQKNNIRSEADFIYKINKFSSVAGSFLENVFVSQTELFKDYEVWNYLTNIILPKQTEKEKYTIFFPYSVSGDEFYSLLLILNNFNTKNIRIIVNGVTEIHLEKIKKGCFSERHIKNSTKNIELLIPNIDNDIVFKNKNNCYGIKNNFDGEIIFETCDFFKDRYISEIDLVIFRNSMIYFNSELKEKALKTVIRSLKKGAYLIIGVKENINKETGKKLKLIEKDISIYKKKIFL